MIRHTEILINSHVLIYAYHNDNVVMIHSPDGERLIRTFAGFDGLLERFKELVELFDDDMPVDTVIGYLTPNFTQTLIN